MHINEFEWIHAAGKRLLVLAFMLGLVVIVNPTAQSQTFSVFHSFAGGSDGEYPLAGLTMDGANFYGTTSSGGRFGSGIVFRITPNGKETVLYDFTGGEDGGNPQASLVLVGGVFYGTTTSGGTNGFGTVFEVTPQGKETVLYRFTGGADGANPGASLVKDKVGNLYSTTNLGGANGNGTVFELVHPKVKGETWTEQVLYSFGTGADGIEPVSGVTFDATGNLYGTTSAGGAYGNGIVYQLIPSKSGWTENILHNFEMENDGGVPYAGLVVDTAGNLYGAATDGGAGGSNGGGTIFELTPSGGTWTFNVIYSLPGWGISGSFRNLLLASGNIYGTTHCDGANTAGTVFELTPSEGTWKYTSLYVFTGGSDGLYSFSNIILDKLGNVYGTTKQGGADGAGVVFKITP